MELPLYLYFKFTLLNTQRNYRDLEELHVPNSIRQTLRTRGKVSNKLFRYNFNVKLKQRVINNI
jgi:hypothetical protein